MQTHHSISHNDLFHIHLYITKNTEVCNKDLIAFSPAKEGKICSLRKFVA